MSFAVLPAPRPDGAEEPTPPAWRRTARACGAVATAGEGSEEGRRLPIPAEPDELLRAGDGHI